MQISNSNAKKLVQKAEKSKNIWSYQKKVVPLHAFSRVRVWFAMCGRGD